MRFVVSVLIGILFFFHFVLPVNGQAEIGVSANNAILIEQSSGRVLYEKNAHEIKSIASITKIMTAIIAIELGKMDELAVASRRAIYTEGSSIYLEQGEKMTIEDLLYGLMLRSGNDAAVTISEYIGGSVEGFVYLMNEKARWLGMTNTNFENPHGLSTENHYSTAYDMAILMRYAMDNEQFSKISGTTSYQSKKRSYPWGNKNRLLTSLYNNCTGGKTGFTKKSGRTLVTSAKKDNMELIAVTLNAPDDWRDHIRMFEWGFNNYELEKLSEKGRKMYQMNHSKQKIAGIIQYDTMFPLTKVEKGKVNQQSTLLDDTEKGMQTQIGRTTYYVGSEPVATIPILADDNFSRNLFFNIAQNMKRIARLN